MSLFKVCIWWSTQCPDREDHYDVASLLCARFGLLDNEKDYVVVGSHGGYLSIFYPSLEWESSENAGGYNVVDLILETKLKHPILGIHAGRFSGNTHNENANQLAVLHPKALVIYNLQIIDGVAEHGTQARLHSLIEHTFARPAFAFCSGHFGQVKGREFYCVTHLDGTLTFYEQDGISYECNFPGHRPLPTPVMYCERTDSFFRFGASWNLECYTYQDLSYSSMNRSSYQPVWSVCLGEAIIDMTVLQRKKNTSSVVVLGERNLICLSDSGKVEFILKLDYAPKCFYSFVVGYYWEPNARLITAIISETSKLHIYEEANIIWAAQFEGEAPVAVRRSNISNLPGGIIVLGETGQLAVGYLGSEPFAFTVPQSKDSEINFQQAYKELIQLEEEIRGSTVMSDMDALNKRAAEDVAVSFDIDPKLCVNSDGLLMDVPAEVAVLELPSCKGILKIKCRISLAEMQIAFNMPPGIRCSQDTVTFIDVEPDTSKALTLDFFIAELLHSHTARVDVILSFINTMGMPRVIMKSSYLPLEMFFKPKMPQKSASIKLTYNIESEMLESKVATFYPEFINEQSDAHALGLALLCQVDHRSEEVTIVAAKNSNRIRLQSDSLEALPLVLERLITSARTTGSKGDNEKGGRKGAAGNITHNIRAVAFIPCQEILRRIDVHWDTQENIRRQSVRMDDLWLQFKCLQKRLQEKSEEELKESLIMQIEQNYDDLIAEGDKLVEMRNKERREACDLSSSIAIANMIISCFSIDEKIENVISGALCTPIEDWTELSWEESMSPGIDMLHHYGPLTRSDCNTSNNVFDSNLSRELFDYSRFRRHFATLFDRVVRLSTVEKPVQLGAKNSSQKVVSLTGLADVLETEKETNLYEDNLRKSLGRNTEVSIEDCNLEGVENDESEGGEENAKKENIHIEETVKPESKTSDLVYENLELISKKELFDDLGIWWE